MSEGAVFKKIVWASDGSASADQALELAKALASDGATLLAVHSVEYLAGKGDIPLDAGEEDMRAKIEGQVAELAERGVNATAKIVQGGFTGAARTVSRVAEEEGADLIVAGTRGHTQLGGLLLGSVTQRLLCIAPCPVLAVPTN
ncbi:MAG TPA: universal stress protein [Solirubrobacteraceae bacterium]|nr:universal stress protein [Solirubrobacteraceae bacterium]